MSTTHHQHSLFPPRPSSSHWNESSAIQTPSTHEPAARIIFTRQLWQRTMNDRTQSGQSVSNRPHAQENTESRQTAASSSRRTSSASSRSRKRSPSPSRADSKTPLTPEESPPFRTARKRTASVVDEDDKGVDSAGLSSTHATQESVGNGIHVCICQPDPKIPRPRNAFILYRQHHQANVVAQHPGLANPDISKIIGEQWQNQPTEVKNKWKALAEEEKIRHQQQYPTYRYQPKRSGRRNSLSSEGTGNGDRPRCTKCGGKSLLTPSTPYGGLYSSSLSPASAQHTPSSAITPVTRNLPMLRDLSLQSPAARRMAKQFHGSTMSAGHSTLPDDQDEFGPPSPDAKRRRVNADHPASNNRSIPSRYAVAPPPGSQVGPGTPFPFGQPPPHPYPPGAIHARRESLPGLHGVVGSPGAMAPPPRPGPGYQQHRLSQGHIAHDRSLTLPPLQTGATGNTTVPATSAGTGKIAEEQNLSMEFRRKVAILRRVAPPSSVKKPTLRGPLLAIEGDNTEAVGEVATWLSATLRKDDDLAIDFLSGPKLSAEGSKEAFMAQYHQLVAEWLYKSNDIRESLSMKVGSPADSVMLDAATAQATKSKAQEIDKQHDESEPTWSQGREIINANGEKESLKSGPTTSDAAQMDVDAMPTVAKVSAEPASKPAATKSSSSKPVSVIANYSLHASNFFACHVPSGSDDPYLPLDNWQWSASQWRGIIGPDLTIYVRDAAAGENGKQSVEIAEEGNLFVVKRTKGEGTDGLDVEASTLRRLGFEVSEWVRAFGSVAAE